METKAEVRAKLIQARRDIPEHRRRSQEARLCAILCACLLDEKIDAILGYWPKAPELSLIDFYEECLSHGKKLYFPRVSGEDMAFYRVNKFVELSPGHFGVYEPNEGCEKFAMANYPQGAKIVCLVPGVGFDEKCNRMGYGKGYYDRFLAANFAITSIGVSFVEQVVKSLPTEPTDFTLTRVISSEFSYGDTKL